MHRLESALGTVLGSDGGTVCGGGHVVGPSRWSPVQHNGSCFRKVAPNTRSSEKPRFTCRNRVFRCMADVLFAARAGPALLYSSPPGRRPAGRGAAPAAPSLPSGLPRAGHRPAFSMRCPPHPRTTGRSVRVGRGGAGTRVCVSGHAYPTVPVSGRCPRPPDGRARTGPGAHRRSCARRVRARRSEVSVPLGPEGPARTVRERVVAPRPHRARVAVRPGRVVGVCASRPLHLVVGWRQRPTSCVPPVFHRPGDRLCWGSLRGAGEASCG